MRVAAWGSVFKKGSRSAWGRDHDERYNGCLRDLIVTGRAKPSTIVSHRLALAEAPDPYSHFDARRDGYLKVVLHPADGAAACGCLVAPAVGS